MHESPNLFEYAKSELSQDAVFCWLIRWADARYAGLNGQLHSAGVDFVASMMDGALPLPHEYTVRVHPQRHRCDIVAEIGDSHVLAIEDKTDTSEGQGKLERYRQKINAEYSGRHCVFRFVKTGDQSSYSAVESAEWSVVRRGQLLDVLRPHRGAPSDVLKQFIEHLEQIEQEFASFDSLPAKEWPRGGRVWHGYFTKLQQRLGDSWWGYVPQKDKGFDALAFGYVQVPGGKLHIQLHHDRGTDPADRIEIKARAAEGTDPKEFCRSWSHRLLHDARFTTFHRPKKLRFGGSTTIAHSKEYREWGEDGRLDMDATVARIVSVREALRGLVQEAESS